MPLQHPLSVDEDGINGDALPKLSPDSAGILVSIGRSEEHGKQVQWDNISRRFRPWLGRHDLIDKRKSEGRYVASLTARGRLWYNRWHAQASKGA